MSFYSRQYEFYYTYFETSCIIPIYCVRHEILKFVQGYTIQHRFSVEFLQHEQIMK